MFYENRFLSSRAFKAILPYVLIVALIAISRFCMMGDFGLYEDDWAFTGNAITNDFDQNLGRVTSAFTAFWQGRPLHMFFLTLIPALAGKLGGLKALYVVGFFILCTNACLLYKLLSRLTNQPLIPAVVTVFFCVYPADTTFNYLQHLFGLQTSLLLILLAFHYYLSSRTFSPYLLATLSLLTYESVFFIFFMAPFLRNKNDKRNTIAHVLKTFLVLAIYIIVRKSFGEERVADLDVIHTLMKLTYQTFVGPFVSLLTFGLRPLQVLTELRLVSLISLLALSTTFFFSFLFLGQAVNPGHQKTRYESLKESQKLLLIGIGMIFLSYPTAITLSVYDINGRASRVHFAAVIGASLIAGCLWTLLLHIAQNKKSWKKIIIFLISLHLSLLALFCIQVQGFYKLSWDYQKSFWTDILNLAPDIENNTVILVDSPSLQRYGKQINPFDWSMPSVLSSIYKFPRDWQNHPRLYLLNSFDEASDFWSNIIIDNNRKFLLSGKNSSLVYYYSWEAERIVEPRDVILISEENNRLVRPEILEVKDSPIQLKSKPTPNESISQIPKSILFKELISYPPQALDKDSTPIYFKPQS
jgi:uncharacterized membrane protein YhaH (DUF805 family)